MTYNYIIRAAVVTAGLGMACGQGPTKQVRIVDPVAQMKAYSWTIPANWIFEGTVMDGTSCVDTPFPVFRMMSPDGITELKLLPRFDWTWSTGSNVKVPSSPDCLPLNRMMPAAEFLKSMVGVLGVSFLREEAAPGLPAYRENLKRVNQQTAATTPRGVQPVVMSGDQARFLVRYKVNSIPVEEYLLATTRCTENTRRFGVNQVQMTLYSCSAIVTRERARQGQLAAMQNTFRTIGMSVAVDPQWSQKRMEMERNKITEQAARGTRMIVQAGQDAARAQQARHDSFMQGQEMRQRQHEQFLATMQRGTDLSMQRTQDSMNARSRMAGDWADYALDLQKRRDPTTGEITKDSSRYSYTWVDESGKRYQTNDMNDTPNGRLNGNWTLQENVR